MKTEIHSIATVIFILIVLGTHALLHGTWRSKQANPIKNDAALK
ncbi:MAG: hypothetical protein WBG48_12710 [Pricia sp.]